MVDPKNASAISQDDSDNAFSLEPDDLDSCSSEHSNSTSDRFTDRTESKRETDKLDVARRETQAVFGVRFLIFVMLLLAALAVSIIVYLVTSRAEQQEYETQYEGAYKKVMSSFADIVKIKLGGISTLGVAIMAHGDTMAAAAETEGIVTTTTGGFPFVTLPKFQQRASAIRSQSGALYLHVNPMVTTEQRSDWINYASSKDNKWIQEGIDYQTDIDLFGFDPDDLSFSVGDAYRKDTRPFFWYRDENEVLKTDYADGPFMPSWQSSPVFHNGLEVNENILKTTRGSLGGVNASFSKGTVVTGELLFAPPGNMSSFNPRTELFSLLLSANEQKMVQYAGDPLSQVFFPIFDSFDTDTRKPAAVLVAWIHWMGFFRDVLPSNLVGFIVVLRDTCAAGAYTYRVDGETVSPLGMGDLHDRSYDDMRQSMSFQSLNDTIIADGTRTGLPLDTDVCSMAIDMYPSDTFKAEYTTSLPVTMTTAVAIIFTLTACVFLLYDRLVARRQNIVMEAARKTNAIVTSLFPKQVRERLLGGPAIPATSKLDTKGKKRGFVAPNRRLKGYLDGEDGIDEDGDDSAPIADLFPHCTVCFADIAGFTAWSSTRDPAQVFILLQTVYAAFDDVAKRRRVFKVETIGDSYVAVTGLPDPQPSHAVIMARFATDCRIKMNELTAHLENRLGPDTGDLSMRFGLHSGPVTAGVLRGERARFQLFGDTVNTAARMESTGIKDRIQVSLSTYDILVEAGKTDWVTPRNEVVRAKGKGVMKTFWLDTHAKRNGSSSDGSVSSFSQQDLSHALSKGSLSMQRQQITDAAARKQGRLVNWVVDILQEHIRKLVIVRKIQSADAEVQYTAKGGRMSLEEVAEIIKLPRFNTQLLGSDVGDERNVKMNPIVLTQLNQYVSSVASMYHDNPFHNFEHACHVTMAVNKFLKRIVAPDIGVGDAQGDMASEVHNYTHGINSDPITMLAIVFSALVHDLDHKGVSNAQLVIEDKALGKRYQEKSVAEQNSLDLAWDLLMSDSFVDLRKTLFTTEEELQRFRQVLVNVVLATDIFDPELNGLRKARWERAFSSDILSHEERNDLRATIVIEHIIQASDVSHTMQHWHIYRKWNRQLFEELYRAYHQGRMAKDPSDFWYSGELSFFDHYIIPLAKKLKECNVFGVSSDECLNYALQNRAEWEERGQEIVKEMQKELEGKVRKIEGPQSLLTEVPESALEKDSQLVALKQPESAPNADGEFTLKDIPFEPDARPQSAILPSTQPATRAEVSQPFATIESEQFYFL